MTAGHQYYETSVIYVLRTLKWVEVIKIQSIYAHKHSQIVT